MLLDALDQAIEGAGHGFLVVGEAGIGKTRLATEVATQARALGAVVAWGRCWEAGGAPAYWPWREVLRTIDVESDPFHGAEASDRFDVFQTVAVALRRVAQRTPLLIVLDDLHAADADTLLLLESFLGGTVRSSRIVVVGLTREPHPLHPEDTEAASAMSCVRRLSTTVALAGLDRRDVSALYEVTACSPPSPALTDLLHDRTDGNPFYVEELSRLVAAGSGADVIGALPTGVRDVIVQRLRPLPAGALGVLDAAAVVGREFDLDLLSAVTGTGADELVRVLDVAVRAGIVLPVDAAGARYRFSHMLVRDVIYDALGPGGRASGHAAVGHVLAGAGDPDLVDQVALHFVAAAPAGEVQNALVWSLAAAENAERQLAHESAIHHYERVRRLAATPGVEDVDAVCEALIGLGRARERGGDATAGRAAFLEALRLSQQRGDGERMALAALGLAERLKFQQRDEVPVGAWLREALDLLPPRATTLRARALAALARVLVYGGERAQVAQLSAEAVACARGAGDHRALCDALIARQVALWGPDHLEDRVENATALLAAARVADDPESALEAHMALLICALEGGDARQLDRTLATYCRCAEEAGLPRHVFVARSRSAMRALMRGDIEGGLALAESARRLGLETGEPDAEPVYLGSLAFVAGDVDLEVDVEGFFADFSGRHTSVGSRALVAMFSSRRADVDAARADLTAMLPLVPTLPKDMDWLLCIALTAEVAHVADDGSAAALLYPLLLPYEGRCAVVAGAVAFGGSVAHYLGLLAATMGRPEIASRHFEVAEACHRRLGARPWLARTLLEHVRALSEARSGSPPAEPAARRQKLEAARALAAELGLDRLLRDIPVPRDTVGPSARTLLFRFDGGAWTVGDPGSPLQMPDSLGLQHLAHLLRRPGTELHVLELAGSPGGPAPGGDAGALLDDAAKRAYRQRLTDLAEDLEEATRWGDGERAARIEMEVEAITSELTSAVGLHGRDRRGASTTDRARVRVRKALVRAIQSIDARDPELGRYLATTIRTGTFCAYEPDPRFAVRWEL